MDEVLGVGGVWKRAGGAKRGAHLWGTQRWRSVARPIDGYGAGAVLAVDLRFDDDCNNGHNSFSMCADVTTPASRSRNDIEAGGQLHAEIARVFPELAPLSRWHLVSSDGPMHYEANTLYWLGWQGWCSGGPTNPPNLDYARRVACWPDMPESFVCPEHSRNALGLRSKAEHEAASAHIRKALADRLSGLLAEFRAAIEGAGFQWEAQS